MRVFRGAADQIVIARQAVVAVTAGAGGRIHNPASARDQAVAGSPLPLYVDMSGPAGVQESGTTFALAPGKTFNVPPGLDDVWVNSRRAGHRFSAISFQGEPSAKIPYQGAFPPSGPTTLEGTIPSYLYKQYEDDDDLQAFVQAYNEATQSFVDWFNAANLPIYTDLSGALLDWIAAGLYGLERPTLFSSGSNVIGPFNTFEFDRLPLNGRERIFAFDDVAAASDDVYKRILTWRFFKGDGKQVSIAWLKRRVGRFLFIPDGKDGPFSTDQISVISSGKNEATITIVTGIRRLTGGAIFNAMGFNEPIPFNSVSTTFDEYPEPPMARTFLKALDAGALETPFQYQVSARIGAIGAAS